MVDKARRGGETVVVERVLLEEENNGRREAGTLSRLKTRLALPRQSMPIVG
jgi:hypothetical protein